MITVILHINNTVGITINIITFRELLPSQIINVVFTAVVRIIDESFHLHIRLLYPRLVPIRQIEQDVMKPHVAYHNTYCTLRP